MDTLDFRADSKESVDALKAEIEVTSEMIKAGAWALEQFRESGLDVEDLAREVFLAMCRRKRGISYAAGFGSRLCT
jgi:hypothetical protein